MRTLLLHLLENFVAVTFEVSSRGAVVSLPMLQTYPAEIILALKELMKKRHWKFAWTHTTDEQVPYILLGHDKANIQEEVHLKLEEKA